LLATIERQQNRFKPERSDKYSYETEDDESDDSQILLPHQEREKREGRDERDKGHK
jgi:hypothetical protein